MLHRSIPSWWICSMFLRENISRFLICFLRWKHGAFVFIYVHSKEGMSVFWFPCVYMKLGHWIIYSNMLNVLREKRSVVQLLVITCKFNKAYTYGIYLCACLLNNVSDMFVHYWNVLIIQCDGKCDSSLDYVSRECFFEWGKLTQEPLTDCKSSVCG